MRECVESMSTDQTTKDECAGVGQAGVRVAPGLSHQFDEEYVQDILRAARPGMSHDEFWGFVQRDRDGGWRDEASEAYRRYFNFID